MTKKPPRPAPIFHGGDLVAARAAFPHAPEPWIDLSTGINPESYPLPEIRREAWTRLPQPSAEQQLCEAAARRYRAAHPRMVVPAPGTQALIQALPRLVAKTRVAVVAPTYAEHAAAWRHEGHDVVEIGDLDHGDTASVVVVVNPNNPTGRVIPAETLRETAVALERRGGWLVVDESFADVLPAEVSVVPALPPATIVLRSFGKTYGLAGLRLGFAIAPEEMAARVRAMLGPWAVAGPALEVGAIALADDAWLEETVLKLKRASSRLESLLVEIGGDIVGGTPLFRLVHHARAPELAHALGCNGIHVRRFEKEPHWLRFGLPGSEEAWHRLAVALRGWACRHFRLG